MLISKSFRRHMAALLFGSSLLAGCTSGPGTGFTRFWPDKKNNIDWQDDEALASKWEERIGETSKPGSSRTDQRAASTTRADDPNRFSLLRGFRRNDAAADEETAAKDPLIDTRQTASNRSNLLNSGKRDQAPVDPFLMAEKLDQQRQPVRPETSNSRTQVTSFNSPLPSTANPTRTASAPSRSDDAVPEWAREIANPTPRTEVAASRDNLFAPGFDQTINQMRPAAATPAANVADTGRQPVNPFEEYERRQSATPAAASSAERHPLQPSARSPVAMTGVAPATPAPAAAAKVEANLSSPIGVPQDAFEDRRAWAALEVSQLMKHSRVQARAGQLAEALKTAVAAEQLAASAQVRFAANEQTPMQLIEWLKGTATNPGSTGSTEMKTAAIPPRETSAPAAPTTPGVVNVHPIESAAALPQWPGRSRVTVTPGPTTRTEPRSNLWAPPAPAAAKNSAANPPLDARFVEFANAKSQPVASPPLPAWNSRAAETDGSFHGHESEGSSSKPVNATLVTRTIYHPENLRWSQLDESEATLVPPPPSGTPGANEASLADAAATTSPPSAPAPQSEATSPETENRPAELASSVSNNRLALILLSLGALLAAIIYRRRHMPHTA